MPNDDEWIARGLSTERIARVQSEVAAERAKPRLHMSLHRRFQRGEALDAIERMQLHNALLKEIDVAEQTGHSVRPSTRALLQKLEEAMGLARYEERTVATPQDIIRFLDFGKAQNAEALQRQAIALVQRTGLNPALNEVIVYEGKLYVTVHGIGHLAAPQLEGIDAPRFWLADEKAAAGYAADDVVCSVTLYRKGSSRGVTGTGKANATKPYRGNPVERAFAPRMAENRALRQAYRMGFQDLLSREGVEMAPDDWTEEVEQRSTRVIDVETAPDSVDTETGEYTPDVAFETADDLVGATQDEAAATRMATPDMIAAIKGAAGKRKIATTALLAHVQLKYAPVKMLENLTEAQAAELMEHIDVLEGRMLTLADVKG